MTKVMNISTGPRGIYTSALTLVMLERGESRDIDVAPGEDAGEWFEFDGVAPEPMTAPAPTDEIAAAVSLLDPENDDHWTKAGLPDVKAVEAILGHDTTRAAIEDSAPGAVRPAKEA